MPGIDYLIAEKDAGRTVKSVALKEMRLSRGMFSSLKFSGGMLLDGRPVRADVRLQAGQTLSARWQDGEGSSLAPYPIPIQIAYADDRYWILHKPAPLPTLCSAHKEGPTLENAFYAYLGCPEGFVFRPVNRLDKGTSGLLAVARDAHAQQLLQRQLHTDAFVREYRALCLGRPPREEGTVDLPIGKAGDGVRRTVDPRGARAVTHYRLEDERGGLSLLRLRLETGRTHQIRVHMAALGCPVLGDYLYGQADDRLLGRFALHACYLQFCHPFTGETVTAEAPLPQDMESIWESAAHL